MMDRTRFAWTSNGDVHFDLSDSRRSFQDEIQFQPDRVDGRKRSSLILWRLPPGEKVFDVNLSEWPREYIQCAGSGDARTVEIRKDADGVARHWVLSSTEKMRGTQDQAEPSVSIAWNEFVVHVLPREVLDSKEAAELFIAYFENGDVPPGAYSRVLSAADGGV